MKKTDFATFSAMIVQTCELIGRKPISREGIQLYFALLAEYHIEDVKRGIAAHLRNPQRGQYMPKPADIIAALIGDPESRALEAWSKVHDAISRTGAYESVVFDDQVIHVVIQDMGGWMDLCRSTLEDYRFREHAFLKRYKAYYGRNLGRYPKLLPGEFEITNRANWQEVKPPVRIGDPQRAMLTYEQGSDDPRVPHTPFENVEDLISDIEPTGKSEEEPEKTCAQNACRTYDPDAPFLWNPIVFKDVILSIVADSGLKVARHLRNVLYVEQLRVRVLIF